MKTQFQLLNTQSVHPNISQTYQKLLARLGNGKIPTKAGKQEKISLGPTLSTSPVHIFSYSTETLVDIVRLPLIRTLKIISRVRITTRNERESRCDTCSGKEICYIFTAVRSEQKKNLDKYISSPTPSSSLKSNWFPTAQA